MENAQIYVVRPFSKPSGRDFKDLFRVYLSSTAPLFHEVRAGQYCQIQTSRGPAGPVIVWPAPEKIQDTVVQTSKTLQLLYGMKLGDRVSILRSHESIGNARVVTLVEISQAVSKAPLPRLNKTDCWHWAWVLQNTLEKAELVCPGIIFNNIEVKEQRRSFKVANVNSSNNLTLHYVQPGTEVQVQDDLTTLDNILSHENDLLRLETDGIGGLDRQLKELNNRLTAYSEKKMTIKFPPYYRPRRGGVLLHGPSGTGKTMILAKLSTVGWRKVFRVSTVAYGERGVDRKAAIRDIFAEAHLHQPSLVIIDRVDLIAGKMDSHTRESAVDLTPCLCEEFDQLGTARIFVIAATTSLSNVDQALRSPGRLEFEIEIPVPDSRARAEILKVVSGLAKHTRMDALERLADRTHGFVGADLDKLVQLAVEKGMARIIACEASETPTGIEGASQKKPEITVEVIASDFEEALLDVRPTAMREVFLETPMVRWSDIGGQHEVKKALAQAVEWPFKYPAEMDRLGIEPKKGLLLYGPPGCSKTLIAKAVATEAGLNFIAVKGAELLSMYVGESERAVREVFRKARAASPSVVFFDEIDAIGASRGGSTMNDGLNVLTTLLNELDGIEILKGVFVLAATNKPEIIDAALMRPGRLDAALHVGLPDFKARREILQIRMRVMDVSDDVDDTTLAHSTEGYSGAELVSICQKAGYAALEEQMLLNEQQQVGKRHFDQAFAQVHRQITPEMIKKYRNWGNKTSESLENDVYGCHSE